MEKLEVDMKMHKTGLWSYTLEGAVHTNSESDPSEVNQNRNYRNGTISVEILLRS